jgi:transcriptional regulator with XRE-family HTH domain
MSSRFKAIRVERGLSQRELAKQARVGVVLIYNADRGYVPSHPLVRESLARVLDATEAELFGDDR